MLIVVEFLFPQEQFGDLVWKQALRATGCKHTVFNTHQMYPDSLMPDLAEALSAITYVFINFSLTIKWTRPDPIRIPNFFSSYPQTKPLFALTF